MFNGEQKEAFLVSYPKNNREEALGLLRLFSPYEETWGGDLVLQPIDRLQPAFDTIVKSIAAKKAKTLLAVLKSYREWYLSNNTVKGVCAGVLLLKMDTLEKLRYSMVASPMNLKLILDEEFDAPEKETVDCVYRTMLWLAFIGVPYNTAPLIEVDEIDFYSMVIRHGEQEYIIPAEGIKELRKLCELDAFWVLRKNSEWKKQCRRAEGKQLLRGLGENPIVAEKISVALSRRQLKTRWSLGYESVLLSGLFYKKFELERLGSEVSFEEEIEHRLSMAESKSTPASNPRTIRWRYREKYKQWKMIFYPTIDE